MFTPFYRRAPFRTLLGVLGFLGLYALLFWRAAPQLPYLTLLIDGLLGLLTLLFILALVSQFVLPVQRGRDRWTVFTRLVGYLTGTRGPVMFIENGQAVEGHHERERSGPGVLLIDQASAAVLRRATQLTRVVGPGVYFTEPGEYLAQAVDLRPQVRSLRGRPPRQEGEEEETAQESTTLATTSDGIPVAADLSVTFILDPGHDREPRLGDHPALPPYEFNPQAVERAVVGQAYQEGEPVPWTEFPLRLVVDLWREEVRARSLQDLLDITESGVSPLEEIQRAIQSRLTAPSRPSEEETPQGESPEYRWLRERGIRVLRVGVSNLYLPAEVQDWIVERWRSRWSQAAEDALREAHTLQQEARRQGEAAAHRTLWEGLTQSLRRDLSNGKSPARRDTLLAVLQDGENLCLDGDQVAHGEVLAQRMRQAREELAALDGDCRPVGGATA